MKYYILLSLVAFSATSATEIKTRNVESTLIGEEAIKAQASIESNKLFSVSVNEIIEYKAITNKSPVLTALFGENKDALTRTHRVSITSKIEQIRGASNGVLIQGHCDEVGSDEYNIELGLRRAEGIKDYLVSLGIKEDKIKTVSYGKKRPIFNKETGKTSKYLSRRVELYIH